MTIEKKLGDIGLTPTETKIYLLLLEKGPSTPPEITKYTGIARSNIHYVLQELMAKSMVKRQNKGKRFIYIPNDPSITLQSIDQKKKVMEELVGDLRAMYKQSTNKPVVKFYDGREEVKQIFEDILETKAEKVIAFASTKILFNLLPNYFETRFQKVLKQRGIFFQDILSESSRTVATETKKNMSPYYDFKIFPEKYGDLPTDILVWENSLAVIVLAEPVFGMVLTSKPLADTYRAQFEMVWRTLG